MRGRARSAAADLRGLMHLSAEATRELADVVEAMHRTIAKHPLPVGPPVAGRTRGITGLVYRSVRGAAQLAGTGAGALLSSLEPLVVEKAPTPAREALLAALNGVVGDTLAAAGNPLAISMSLRVGRHGDPAPAPGPRAVVLVHGLCRDERQWTRRGHDHGAALARDAGWTPVYLRYNSGLHVSQNGRAFAELLERLVNEWPAPLEELSIVAHSMGGLVSRSAHHQGTAAGHGWARRVKSMVFLGTPHLGAALERGGHGLQTLLGVSPYTAPLARLGRLRSAGITDLRHGSLLADDWRGRDRFATGLGAPTHVPLPSGVRCAAIAGMLGRGQLVGDGIVPLASALGRHGDPRRALDFPAAHVFVAKGTGHLDLLSRIEVYEKLRAFLDGSDI